MKRSLARFESLARHLVEGTFARLRPGSIQSAELLARLIRAMEDGVRPGPRGASIAPDRYVLYLNPADLNHLSQSKAELETTLADRLVEAAREAGYLLARRPDVRLAEMVPSGLPDPYVVADFVLPMDGQGTDTGLLTQQAPSPAEPLNESPQQAYLLVEGNRMVSLQRPLFNLGRQLDNDVVIQDSRVSRHHAQIRLRYGRYVVYDLGSQGGTWVNGHRVEEQVLQPGDVISLGGALIVYNEESETSRRQHGIDTEALSPLDGQGRPPSGPIASPPSP